MATLRKFHKRSIELYEVAFGEKPNDQTYLVRRADVGVVLIRAIISDSGVYIILDQVLICDKKIYRNSELVHNGGI